MLLERFRKAKAAEIRRLRQLEKTGLLPPPCAGLRIFFLEALQSPLPRPHIIAEFKRASPSRGDILTDMEPEEAARQYAGAGASCLSVLTEEHFFKGFPDFLRRMECAGLPLLRKDFLFGPLQVAATAATPASALLFIVRLTPDALLLRALREQAEKYGMDAVVEVFDEKDLALARDSGARLIQVNARNLDTLAVDRSLCLKMAARHKRADGEVWIAASGISGPEHVRQAKDAGFQAVLVGTKLMEGGAPGKALRRLLDG